MDVREKLVDLKPCPFCGSKPFVWRTNHRTYIECPNLTADSHRVMMSGKTDKEAIEAWNRRHNNDVRGNISSGKRLIDADALMRIYQEVLCPHVRCVDCSLLMDDGTCRFETMIREAPAIDAVPIADAGSEGR